MPPVPEPEKIRAEAWERIADRRSMVVDGDPIEELAKAHDRHAERLEAIIDGLTDVGKRNYLGSTSEGEAATNNVRIAVHDDPCSMVETYRAQAAAARRIADSLREIKWAIGVTESDGAGKIAAAGQ